MKSEKLHGFTLAETLVTLALTSVMVTMAYLGFGQVQRLLKQFADQNYFITRLSELNKRFVSLQSLNGLLTETEHEKFVMNTDSAYYVISLAQENILLERSGHVDTFDLAPLDLRVAYEKTTHPEIKLVNKIDFDVSYRRQKFHVQLIKQYDAFTHLKFELEHGNR